MWSWIKHRDYKPIYWFFHLSILWFAFLCSFYIIYSALYWAYCSLRGSVSWNSGLSKWHKYRAIAPYVGAWVETIILRLISTSLSIAPYVGAWIETLSLRWRSLWAADRSLRGSVSWNPLMQGYQVFVVNCSLCGSVSWNQPSASAAAASFIAPYVGAWVETPAITRLPRTEINRSLRGSVSWNN